MKHQLQSPIMVANSGSTTRCGSEINSFQFELPTEWCAFFPFGEQWWLSGESTHLAQVRFSDSDASYEGWVCQTQFSALLWEVFPLVVTLPVDPYRTKLLVVKLNSCSIRASLWWPAIIQLQCFNKIIFLRFGVAGLKMLTKGIIYFDVLGLFCEAVLWIENFC